MAPFRYLASSALLLAGLFAAASASADTFNFTYSVTDISAGTDPLTATVASGSESSSLAVGQTSFFSPLFTVSLDDTKTGSASQSANLLFQLTYTQPAPGTGAIGGTAVQNTLDLFGYYTSSGDIVWNIGNGAQNPLGYTEDIALSNGDTVAFTLDNTVFVNLNGKTNNASIGASETFVSATPEPSSWMLMLSGAAALPAAVRQRLRRA